MKNVFKKLLAWRVMKIIYGVLALGLVGTAAWAEVPRSIEAAKANGFDYMGLNDIRSKVLKSEAALTSQIVSKARSQESTKPITIRVKDKLIEVLKVEYVEGTDKHYSALLGKEYEFEFAENNMVPLNDYVWFSPAGDIRMAINPGYLNWHLPDGSSVTLDCALKVKLNVNRLVRFYENRRYHAGCSIMSAHVFQAEGSYSLHARYGASLNLHPDGSLKYSSKVSDDSFVITPQGAKARLFHHSEAAIHENGTPRFFTLKVGEEYIYNVPGFGPMVFGTRPDQRIAMVLDEKGQVQRGPPIQPITLNLHGQPVTLDIEAAQFYSTGELGLAILRPGQRLPESLNSLVIEGRGNVQILCLTKAGQPQGIDACREIFRYN